MVLWSERFVIGACRVSTPGYDATGTYIRASTGLPEDTDAFLSALRGRACTTVRLIDDTERRFPELLPADHPGIPSPFDLPLAAFLIH